MKSTLAALPILCALATPLAAQDVTRTLFFAHDSARLTSEHVELLDETAAEYRATGTAAVSLVGHADRSGSEEYNRALSQRRADAVSAALVERGVPGASISTAWRGEDENAVPTADGVREPRNRRVEMTLAAADVAPPPAPPPEPVVEAPDRFRVLVAPFGAWNIEPGDESFFAGINATASYDLTENLVVSAEQAGFYNFGADDEGWGGRSAVGADFQVSALGLEGVGSVLPFVGANGGYTYIDGSGTGGWFAGPELGLRVAGFEAKVAYDMYIDEDDRDWDDGVLSATIGYGLRF